MREEKNIDRSRWKRISLKKSMLLLSMLAIICIAVGSSLAFLIAKTETVTNSFQVGDITYSLTLVAKPEGDTTNDAVAMPSLTPDSPKTVAAGHVDFTLSQVPTRTGYRFLGWYLKNGTTPLYDAGSNIIEVGYNATGTVTNGDSVSLTLYAHWERMDFTLSFDTQVDDVADPASRTVTYEMPYGELPQLTRTGYTFTGWTLNPTSTGTDFVTKDSIVNIAADHTLYAQWAAKSYVIRYHANSGDGKMTDQIIKYDVPTELSKNTFTKHDFSFGGWMLDPYGDEADYIDKQIVVNLAESGYVDLYALWIQNSHTVSFDYNGGTGSPDSKQVLNGKEYGVLPTYPVHPTVPKGDNEIMSYLFTGWYTAPTGGERVLPSDIVNRTDDHTLYAQWKEAPTNNVIKDLVVKNNPDDNHDGVVDSFYVNLKCSSSFEKLNIPLENLVVGQKYKISFTESNNATYGMNEKGYGGAIYGFIITKEKTLTPGSIKEESISDGGLIKQFSDRYDGKLNGPREWETTFIAEANTMYWTWDYGLILDGYPRDYNYTNIKLVPVEPEIKFSNKKLILHDTSKAGILSDTSDAYSTNFVFDGDGYAETLYYPITGLTSGTTYTIVFDHEIEGALINNSSYDYGCGISSVKPTTYGSKMDNMGATWISTKRPVFTKLNTSESVTLTFEAKGDTAYWVWNMANCSDSTNCTIDVNVTKFSAKHKNGGSITYYSSASQATLEWALARNEKTIDLIYDYIDTTYMDWYPVDEQYPTVGEDYELAFEPYEGYKISEYILVIIDDVWYEVNTDGSKVDESTLAPTFDPETNILTIPGELLTEETVEVTVSAEAVEAEVLPPVVPEKATDTNATENPESSESKDTGSDNSSNADVGGDEGASDSGNTEGTGSETPDVNDSGSDMNQNGGSTDEPDSSDIGSEEIGDSNDSDTGNAENQNGTENNGTGNDESEGSDELEGSQDSGSSEPENNESSSGTNEGGASDGTNETDDENGSDLNDGSESGGTDSDTEGGSEPEAVDYVDASPSNVDGGASGSGN